MKKKKEKKKEEEEEGEEEEEEEEEWVELSSCVSAPSWSSSKQNAPQKKTQHDEHSILVLLSSPTSSSTPFGIILWGWESAPELPSFVEGNTVYSTYVHAKLWDNSSVKAKLKAQGNQK